MPMTVAKLARSCGLSRTAVLYYESLGLLKPARRTEGNYRAYGERELQRLQQICFYRAAGLKLGDIRAILDGPRAGAAGVLKRRMAELGEEIERLSEHQKAIARLLKQTNQLRRISMVTKEKWVAIMRSSGFNESDMKRWHAQFEKDAPAEHQEFLEFLHIPPAEIDSIRQWSRKPAQQ
jgi:DNA-binding transcriptional MerR regulator